MAVSVLEWVEKKGAFADDLVHKYLKRTALSPVDKALTLELVNGTLRWQGRIDWVLDQTCGGKYQRTSLPLKCILRVGAYQILFLNRIPEWAAVNEAVRLARRVGGKGAGDVVNGVLRNLIRQKDCLTYPDPDRSPLEGIAVEHSHPRWLVKRWLRRFGVNETVALCRANNSRPRLTLRVNRLKISPEEFCRRLDEEGVSYQRSPFLKAFVRLEGGIVPNEWPPFQQGLCTVQDESAGLVGCLLDPRPGEMILDYCAAPGGKTTHIAELMGDKGVLAANDPGWGRLLKVQENYRRLGIGSVRLVNGDGLALSFRRPFDRILVDAPCSDTGVLAKRVDLRWRRTEADIENITRLQLSLLNRAAGFLKKRGILVYSTCSIEEEENSGVVRSFLDQKKEFHLENASSLIDPSLISKPGWVETFPHRHRMDGSFCARMRKIK